MRRLTPTTLHSRDELSLVFADWQTSLRLWQQSLISPAELVARLVLLERRRFLNERCLGARRVQSQESTALFKALSSQASVTGLSELIQQFALPQSLAIEALRDWTLMGLSNKINEALLAWHHDEWPLHLFTSEISPQELLLLQARGGRAVTVLTDPHDFLHYRHGIHDAIGFTLHDLMHAEKYFKAKTAQMIISQFYLSICERVTTNLPKTLTDRWHYLIADMNTHVAHSLKTFKSLLIDWYKESASGAGFSQWLSTQDFFIHLNSSQADALRFMNTPAELNETEESLLHRISRNH